ncbi:MAG TPA: bifunctional isocitrate dehydrogenase kinase/phosphatase [Chthoniobacterales bacterium]|nr:bifunctional isocitrate dehydrogenase kinase/phosphatase [Chthoniobacterales bacterium]
MPTELTNSRLAAVCAETARDAFVEYETRFDEITRQARDRFLARDWHGSYDDAATRLKLYSAVMNRLTSRVEELMGARLRERAIWMAMKAVYSALIAQSVRWEIAESFFNSLTRRVFATEGVDQSIEFVDTDFDAPPAQSATEIFRTDSGSDWSELLVRLLTDESAGGIPEDAWNELHSSCDRAVQRIAAQLPDAGEVTVETVAAVFYRGRGAYVVGRIVPHGNEANAIPIALALRHPAQRGVELDAILLGESDLAVLFSYTRAYFRVGAPHPFQLVRWLRELMPRKRLADLYNALGYNRHAKTEFYRDFVRHLLRSTDQFIEAAGTRGMVMLVFTLPSYDAVFKLIRDRFDAPKESDRAEVMSRYRIVFEHDRAGRLVEAHAFEHLRIPRDRFDPALLDELQRDASQIVRLEGDDVLISHAYVERRVRPLNLFFADGTGDSVAAACDYGQAIKDLAASNIFPGDLLTKNFGLTRHDRVVFYDYDELCFLTDCNFREMPQARSYEEEISAEPWFSVRPNDIFPEEFPNFLGFPEGAREALMARHGDLFTPGFWRGMQQKFVAGELPEIFPYPPERRLKD